MTVIESVLVMPFFFYLVFAAVDFGGVFRDIQSLTHVTQVGGRAAAVAGNAPEADWMTLTRMKRASGTIPAGTMQRIVIWRATDDGSGVAWRKGAGSVVPPACSTRTVGSATYLCNVYSSAAGTLDPPAVSSTWSNCADASDPARYWCPTGRKAAYQGSNGPPDQLGLYVEVLHPFVTGAFGTSKVVTLQLVVTLEPSNTQ